MLVTHSHVTYSVTVLQKRTREDQSQFGNKCYDWPLHHSIQQSSSITSSLLQSPLSNQEAASILSRVSGPGSPWWRAVCGRGESLSMGALGQVGVRCVWVGVGIPEGGSVLLVALSLGLGVGREGADGSSGDLARVRQVTGEGEVQLPLPPLPLPAVPQEVRSSLQAGGEPVLEVLPLPVFSCPSVARALQEEHCVLQDLCFLHSSTQQRLPERERGLQH